MKKSLLITFILIIVSSIFALAQDKSSAKFYFCNTTGEARSIADLEKCPLLNVNDSKLKVESFVLIYTVGDKLFERKIIGNKVDAETITILKKEQKNLINNQIFIEQIKTTSSGKEVFEKEPLVVKIK